MMVYVEVTSPGFEAGAVAKLGRRRRAVEADALGAAAGRLRRRSGTRKLKALAEVPIDPVLTPMESPNPDVELFTVALRSLGSTARG